MSASPTTRHKGEGYYRVERAFGAFSRSLTLPKGVDAEAIAAQFTDGVLEVRIPKPEQRKPRRIAINGEPARARGRAPRRPRHRRPSLPREPARPGGLAALGSPPRMERPSFAIRTRDPGSRARTGTLHLQHGDVRTPAFVPLSTKAVIKTLQVAEAADLGYDMVLSNTFHLFLSPGPELVERFGGVHGFMRWDKPVITDSGGFQVFSMGHGTVADEIKGRNAAAPPPGSGAILAIEEEGVRFRSYVDGAEKFMGPETSMAVQAALNSDIALVFDECLPFHVTREYTQRSTERTHRWLDRCLAWHEQHGPRRPGRLRRSCRAGWRRTCAAGAPRRSAPATRSASPSAARSASTRSRCTRSSAGRRRSCRRSARATCSASATSTTSCAARSSASTRSTARCRRASAATAWPSCPTPSAAGASISPRAATASPTSRSARAAPARPAPPGTRRAYLHYLFKIRETTGPRIVTLHNLAYLQLLMAALRDAIDAGRLAEAVAAARAGAAPWAM